MTEASETTMGDSMPPDAKMPLQEREQLLLSERELPTSIPQSITIARLAHVRRREAWVGWSQVIANLVIIVGLGTTAIAFAMQSRAEQRSAATRQIETFYSRDLTAAQVTLFQLWSDQDLSVFRNLHLPRGGINTLVSKTIDKSGQDRNKVFAAILVLSSYFDRVQSCVDLGRCDTTEVDTQLGSYARNFHCTYTGEIEKLSDRLLFTSLGSGLSAFANRMGGCSAQVSKQSDEEGEG